MKSTHFRSKKAVIITVILILAVSVAGIFYLYNQKQTNQNGIANTLKQGDLSISATMSLAPEGDVKKDEKIQGGDTVRFSFKIENKNDGEANFVTLNTDIEKNLVFAIKNIQGVTGLDNQGDIITFRNLAIQPKQSINISFDATLVYSNQGRNLRLQPKLFDADGKFLMQEPPQNYTIEKNEDSDIPSNAKTGGA